MIKLASILAEITDAVLLVAKTAEPQDKQTAVRAADYLKKQGIEARAKYPARFDFFDKNEEAAWGVYTTKDGLKKAMILMKRSQQVNRGLIFQK